MSNLKLMLRTFMGKHFYGKLSLLGGTMPFVGFVVYFLQLQLNPRELVVYMFVQSTMLLAYLSCFFGFGYSSAKVNYTKLNKVCFFLVPLLLPFINHILLRNMSVNHLVSILLLGIDAPFHHLLPFLYDSFDNFLIPYLFPTVMCFIFFVLGEYIYLSKKDFS